MREEMAGVFVVNKETGWTSFDVVAKMRGICHMKKIGHTGTLDPMATGVLPVCVGKATKVVSMLADDTKTYRAGMRLGYESDTQDATGELRQTAAEEAAAAVDIGQLREAASSFVGGYDQIPPMYSAKHHGGKRLYELAREGQQVERKPVPVKIDAIEVESCKDAEAVITVTCGKGTYIRTLIEDIGRTLGCGALMTSLCRTRVGRFGLDEAMTVSQLQELADEGKLAEAILPVDRLFEEYPAVTVGGDFERMAVNGNPLPGKGIQPGPGVDPEDAHTVRVYASEDRFIGLFRRQQDGIYRPYKMF